MGNIQNQKQRLEFVLSQIKDGELNLRYNMIDANIFQTILDGLHQTQIPMISFLLRLRISYSGNNQIGAEGVKCLDHNIFSELQTLDIGSNNIGSGILHLSSRFRHLKVLYLRSNKIGAKGVKYLFNCSFQHLTELYLNNNQIGIQGVKHLTNQKLQNLTEFYLIENQIGAEGLKHLLKGQLKSLSKLYLTQNQIGAEGAKLLTQLALRGKLKSIYIGKNKVFNEVQAKLKSFRLANAKGETIEIL